jgi:oxygen-independent coproporphyrinogen-3 oxidase
LDALEREIATLGGPQLVETIFLGGGTPTHLNHKQLDQLLQMVNRWFIKIRARSVSEGRNDSSLTLRAPTEFTVEANPGTLDAEKVAILADHGVNRISLGAQSFHPHLLRMLERNHNPLDVPRAVELVRRRIHEVSLDLIFGVPGQSLEEWRGDLQTALDLGINHISTYGLTYEKGTPLWKQRERGEVIPVGEELERAMYEHAMDALEAAGFEHYEISNFARPGHRCRHNEVYWANEAYFGFGLGAARYLNGRREVNTRDLFAYMGKVMTGESAVQQSEELEPEERARETAVLQLRRQEGIERRAFQRQTGFQLDVVARPTIERYARRGLVTDDGERVRLTGEGKILADSVFQALLR